MEEIAAYRLDSRTEEVEEEMDMLLKGGHRNGDHMGVGQQSREEEDKSRIEDAHRDKLDIVVTGPMSTLAWKDEKPFELLLAANLYQ